MNIAIASITIPPRQRNDLGDLSDLDSMSDPDIGQIQSIVLDRQNNLIAGRRRLAKATSLGWTEIRAEYNDTTSLIVKQKIEFLEDIGRKDRSWQEKCTALYKINGLFSMEKAEEGKNWTVRHMAAATGISRMNLNYMLRVGEEIIADPESDCAKAENFTSAFKILVSRQRDLAVAEQERRRQSVQENVSLGVTPLDSGTDHDPSSPPVQQLDKSPEVIIKLRGFNKLFGKVTETYDTILAYNPPAEILPHLRTALSPNGLAILWLDHANLFNDWQCEAENAGFTVMKWPLIWNKTNTYLNNHWPFSMNYAIGIVLSKGGETRRPNPGTSVITCAAEGSSTLPIPVVDFTLSALSLDGEAILLPSNAPVIEVAACGRVPVFYEPDLARYQEKLDALELWYIDNVPGAKVLRQ